MTDFYENYWKTRGKSGPRPRYKIFLDWLEPNSKVLDIGCGDGYFGEFLVKSKKINYHGADISLTAMDIAKNRGLNIINLNASEGLHGFEEKSFDYVVMSEFIEHVSDSEEILKAAGRIAKKAILVSIPNIAYWRFRLQLLLGRFPKQWAIAPQEHLRYWSVTDFKKTAENLGFLVQAIRSSNGRKYLRDIWPNLFGFQVCFYLEPSNHPLGPRKI